MTEELVIINPKTNVLNEVDEQTLTISVMVNGKPFNRSLASDLRVNESEINNYLIQNPGKVAHWVTWHGKAKVSAAHIKLFYEETLARIREEVRKDSREQYLLQLKAYGSIPKKDRDGVPKPSLPTVSEVDDRALLHDDVRQANRDLIEANEVVGLLQAAVSAIKDLSSTLISLSANMRTEQKSLNNSFKDTDVNTTFRKQQTAAEVQEESVSSAMQKIRDMTNAPSSSKESDQPTPITIPPKADPVQPSSDENLAIDAILKKFNYKPIEQELDKSPGEGYHKGPDDKWYPAEVQFDDDGNRIPF